MHRQPINFKRLSLTPLKVAVARNARDKKLKKEWEAANIIEEWGKTAWAKKLEARKTSSTESDFDRFERLLNRATVSSMLTQYD